MPNLRDICRITKAGFTRRPSGAFYQHKNLERQIRKVKKRHEIAKQQTSTEHYLVFKSFNTPKRFCNVNIMADLQDINCLIYGVVKYMACIVLVCYYVP